jgi:hypothetical protein
MQQEREGHAGLRLRPDPTPTEPWHRSPPCSATRQRTWADVPEIEPEQLEAELELGRQLLFTVPSTGDLATMCEEFVGLSAIEVKRLKKRMFQVSYILSGAAPSLNAELG